MSAPERIPPRSVTTAELLARGELTVRGQIRDASNAVLHCSVSYEGREAFCVYKPVRGERPLWDFPDGTLAQREVAAYEVSEATGWGLVPPTVLRDGPFGEGMCQLRRLAVRDAVINNADRKGGHLLPGAEGRLYGIDHGVTFNTENKLRTLLWGWAGEPLTEEALDVLKGLRDALSGQLATRLATLITPAELDATRARVDALLDSGKHPEPSGEWPAIPWPPV